jgi:hypothetical protein
VVLFLGDLLFEDFELPERLPHGGDHSLAVHKVVGGRRRIDALGPDDAAIEWSGVLFGEFSHLRSLQLDLLRRSGRVVELAHSLRRYRGIVSKYVGNVRSPLVVEYSLTFEILEDLVAGEGGSRSQTLEEQIAADLEASEAAAAARDTMIAAVALVRNIVRNPSTIKGFLRVAGGEAIGQMKGVISGAIGTMAEEGLAADMGLAAASGLGEAAGGAVSEAAGEAAGGALLGSVAGIQTGGDAPVMASRLNQTASHAAVSHSAVVGGAALTRMHHNIDQAPP